MTVLVSAIRILQGNPGRRTLHGRVHWRTGRARPSPAQLRRPLPLVEVRHGTGESAQSNQSVQDAKCRALGSDSQSHPMIGQGARDFPTAMFGTPGASGAAACAGHDSESHGAKNAISLNCSSRRLLPRRGRTGPSPSRAIPRAKFQLYRSLVGIRQAVRARYRPIPIRAGLPHEPCVTPSDTVPCRCARVAQRKSCVTANALPLDERAVIFALATPRVTGLPENLELSIPALERGAVKLMCVSTRADKLRCLKNPSPRSCGTLEQRL